MPWEARVRAGLLLVAVAFAAPWAMHFLGAPVASSFLSSEAQRQTLSWIQVADLAFAALLLAGVFQATRLPGPVGERWRGRLRALAVASFLAQLPVAGLLLARRFLFFSFASLVHGVVSTVTLVALLLFLKAVLELREDRVARWVPWLVGAQVLWAISQRVIWLVVVPFVGYERLNLLPMALSLVSSALSALVLALLLRTWRAML